MTVDKLEEMEKDVKAKKQKHANLDPGPVAGKNYELWNQLQGERAKLKAQIDKLDEQIRQAKETIHLELTGLVACCEKRIRNAEHTITKLSKEYNWRGTKATRRPKIVDEILDQEDKISKCQKEIEKYQRKAIKYFGKEVK